MTTKLAALVAERKWTAEQFGRVMGYTRQRAHTLLTKSKKPDPITVKNVARELKVPMEELVDEGGRWLEAEDATTDTK